MKMGVSSFIAKQCFKKSENSSEPLLGLLRWRGKKEGSRGRLHICFRSNYESFPDVAACYLSGSVRGCSDCSQAPSPALELHFPIP